MRKKICVALLIGSLTLSILFTGCGNGSATETASNPSYWATSEEVSEIQGDLGDSITSCKFYLDGKIYQAPLNVSELLSEGWAFDEEAVKNVSSLQAGVRTNATYINKETESHTEKIGITLYNNTEQEVALEEAPVGSLDLYESSKIKIILPKGLTWESTLEDVTAAYGEADESSSIDGRSFLTYSVENDNETISISLQFDKSDEGVNMLTGVLYKR